MERPSRLIKQNDATDTLPGSYDPDAYVGNRVMIASAFTVTLLVLNRSNSSAVRNLGRSAIGTPRQTPETSSIAPLFPTSA
jgi:hypothetical protein